MGEGPIGFSPTFLVWLCFVCFRLIFAFVWLCNAFCKAWWDECPAYGHWVPKLRGKSAPSLGISASSMRLWSRKTRLLQMLLPKSWYFSPKTWYITDIFFLLFREVSALSYISISTLYEEISRKNDTMILFLGETFYVCRCLQWFVQIGLGSQSLEYYLTLKGWFVSTAIVSKG